MATDACGVTALAGICSTFASLVLTWTSDAMLPLTHTPSQVQYHCCMHNASCNAASPMRGIEPLPRTMSPARSKHLSAASSVTAARNAFILHMPAGVQAQRGGAEHSGRVQGGVGAAHELVRPVPARQRNGLRRSAQAQGQSVT
jgi:hypothetical protein